MKREKPESEIVESIAQRYLKSIDSIEYVLKGSSTFVYRIKANSKTYYLRFLKEDDSFDSEVLVHNILNKAGVKVPGILEFETINEDREYSVILLDEIPGFSIEDKRPKTNLKSILHEAGKQLALIHNIPVNGFGWINKKSKKTLDGEKQSFKDYFYEYLNSDLQSLNHYTFSETERIEIRNLMNSAESMLHVQDAVLVHGDFDISHIFHSENRFSGIIDFGEIRGNNRLFDLATFIGFSQDRTIFNYLLEGYCITESFSEEDLYATELMALFMLIRFLGKKNQTDSRDFWFDLAKKQFSHIRTL